MTDFITPQDVTDYLGRDVTADPGTAAAITSACQVIRTISRQTFDAGQSTTTFDGTGSDALLLPELPVTAVASVSVGGTAITDFTVTEWGVLLRGAAGADPRPTWPAGRQNVVVVYSHGYPALAVPDDICQIALDLTVRRIVQGVTGAESVGGHVSVTYSQSIAGDLTKTELAILEAYRPGSRSF